MTGEISKVSATSRVIVIFVKNLTSSGHIILKRDWGFGDSAFSAYVGLLAGSQTGTDTNTLRHRRGKRYIH